ncbi:hypothetical protein CHUAL_001911 [Chamberlinius hualienensis]
MNSCEHKMKLIRLSVVFLLTTTFIGNLSVQCGRSQRELTGVGESSTASEKLKPSDAQVVDNRSQFDTSSQKSTDDSNYILINKLTNKFECPVVENSIFSSTNRPLRNCSQSSFNNWALKCFTEDQINGVSFFNQTLRILYRTAVLGQRCRHPITCQWPSCQSAELITFNSNENVEQQFQQLIVENIKVVFNDSQEAPCEKFPVSTRSLENLTEAEIVKKLLVALSEHIINGDCLDANERLPNRKTHDKETVPNDATEVDRYDYYITELFNNYAENGTIVNQEGIFKLLTDVGLVVEGDDGSIEPTPNVSVKQRRRREIKNSADVLSQLAVANVHVRAKRSIVLDDLTECLNSSEALRTFDLNNNTGLEKNEFLQLCSYIVYQISNGKKCASSDAGSGDFNRAQVYGYGTLAVFIISACSALGFVIIPMLSESVYEIMMTAFIALAFGTLTGDALLHMLPESLITTGDENDETQGFYKALVITLSIYLLFVFEGFTNLLVGHTHSKGDESGGDHGHSHSPDHKFVQQQTRKQGSLTLDPKKTGSDLITVPSTDILLTSGETKDDESQEPAHRNLQELIINEQQTPVLFGLSSLALVIIMGDAIHNVTDGISIGASFASDLNTGFSTSLAVLFHELPHEFGDFVILLTTGLTLKKALIWNFIASLSAFAGLYIGIAVGENDVADQWIFAVTSGMFLYVAIADMLPEMRNIKSRKPWWAFFAQNVGALFGIGFMIFMHYLEDLIHFG